MAENLLIALLITLVGMGLVFGAILLLWGVMAVLVRLVQDSDTVPGPGQPVVEVTELERKQQAAAAAVAAALAMGNGPEPHEFPLPPTALVSPWQGVMRTKMLNKRGPVR